MNIIPTASLPLPTALSSDIVAEVKTAYSSAPDPKRIKALLVTNPHNPIGRCYFPSTLRELMAFCQEKGLHYISDEVFAMSVFGGEGDEKFTSALALVDDGEKSPIDANRVHVIYSMSKDFGSAGIRMVCHCILFLPCPKQRNAQKLTSLVGMSRFPPQPPCPRRKHACQLPPNIQFQ